MSDFFPALLQHVRRSLNGFLSIPIIVTVDRLLSEKYLVRTHFRRNNNRVANRIPLEVLTR